MKVYELVDKLLSLNQELPVAYWDNEYSRFEEINEVKIENLAFSGKGDFYDFFPEGTPTTEVVTLIG